MVHPKPFTTWECIVTMYSSKYTLLLKLDFLSITVWIALVLRLLVTNFYSEISFEKLGTCRDNVFE